MSTIPVNNKRIINGWAMYDWANSVYALVIATAIFPPYYNYVTSAHGNKVSIFGHLFDNSAVYFFAISLSFLIVAFLSPILSALADSIGNKKPFMQFFCWLGSLSCMSMFFFDKESINLGITLIILAGIGFSGSIVFYNAYLPEIASEDQQDKVSARGFGMGYFGSSLLLIFCLLLILHPTWFGLEKNLFGYDSFPVRFSFLLTGIWWLGFAQITFSRLPSTPINYEHIHAGVIKSGYSALNEVLKQLRHAPILKRFLIAFFFYSMGVQTVMYVASTFGSKEIKLAQDQLILTMLIIQYIGVGGAFLFAWLSQKIGNFKALTLAVTLWIFICFGAYFVYSAIPFLILGGCVGLVMGGIQSLSRSTYSKLLPQTENHASFFSFFDVSEKLAITLGTFSFGFIDEWTGSMRNSIVVLIVYFVIGIFLLGSILLKTRSKN